jgi:ABC-2 type transport system ATP-binding protein
MERAIALNVRGLTRRFGGRAAVEDLDLTVNVGDVYGFLGPNGAGKTTAMRCIVGLIRRDAGQVDIFGEGDSVAARRHLGAIIETPTFHVWMSGRENLFQATDYLGITRKKAGPQIERVLERVGLAERARDPAGTYSLGLKQRLGIARALLGEPRILMLDEPTNGLDPRGMREIRELVRVLSTEDKITVFISSHLLAEVQAVCNRVGIIQLGRLRAEGEVRDLLRSSGQGEGLEVGTDDVTALRAQLASWDDVTDRGLTAMGRVRLILHGVTTAELNRRLVEAGVSVSSLVPEARSLEDVFLEVTE